MRSLLLLLLLFCPSLAGAVETVTFRQALERALEHHNLLKAERYELDAAAGERRSVTSRYLPSIRLEEAFGATNAPTGVFMMKLDQGRFAEQDFIISNLNSPGSTTDFRTSLLAEMPLLDFSLGPLRRLAERREEKQGARLAQTREDVALAVVAAYVEAEKARGHRDAARSGLEQAREHLRVSGLRSTTGVGLKSDELRARTFVATMEERLIAEEHRVSLAAMGLALAAGEPVGARLEPAEAITLPVSVPSLEEATASALANRKALREAEAAVAAGEEGVSYVRSAWLPRVNASARYQMNDRTTPFGGQNDSWSVGATLQWELFDGMRRTSDTVAASARRDAAREYLEQQRREVSFSVARKSLELDSAMKRRQVARHAVEDAEETVRLLQKRYENSLSGMVDLLDAQAALNDARARLIDVDADCQLAAAGVHHAAGVLLSEVLK